MENCIEPFQLWKLVPVLLQVGFIQLAISRFYSVLPAEQQCFLKEPCSFSFFLFSSSTLRSYMEISPTMDVKMQLEFLLLQPHARCQNVVVGILLLLFFCFYSLLFGGSPPNTQINHSWMLILTYKCLVLSWIVSSQLFLHYPDYFLLLDFSLFLLLYILLSFFLCGWLYSWVVGP